MSTMGGRGGRPDDWSSPHSRARTRAAERLDGRLDLDETRWLQEHLADCADCAAAAADYESQRFQLRALRDVAPVPPRDLWARTAAAIEREDRHRALLPRHRSRQALLAPYALLAGALVVAVVIGSLSSSQRPIGPAATTPAESPEVAVASLPSSKAAPTPLAVPPQDVAYLTSGREGYVWNRTQIDEVCPEGADSCVNTEPGEIRTIGPLSSPATVYGSDGGSLVVVGDSSEGSRVYVVALDKQLAVPTPTVVPPLQSPSPGEVATQSTTPSDAPASPSTTASVAVESATPSPPESPTEPQPGTIEIARDIEVVDSSAAYAADGSAFAFTARPADGSHGPDIYVWHDGDSEAVPVTDDHRSVFGSWVGDTIVGSTVITEAETANEAPRAFVLEPGSEETAGLPQTGLAWRPAVAPTGGSAAYWAGSLEPAADGTGWQTVDGRLVLGRWEIGSDTSGGGASPTPLQGNQAEERAETTIARGPLSDWDARWDATGTRLAVWIADPDNTAVGRLSLYVVDPFDGRIVDLENPPLLDEPALAGFSITDGRLAWATPAGHSGKAKRVQILAWTDEGFGQVETASGDVLLVR
jgi:hypothetical protein